MVIHVNKYSAGLMYQTGMSGKYHTSLVHVTSGFHNCIWDCFHLDDGEAILQAETYIGVGFISLQ